MSPYSYIFHADIAIDYEEAYCWYESQKEGLGEQFLLKVHQKVNAISEAPENYGTKSKKEYREAKVDKFPYVLVYKVYKKQRLIFFSSIHHQRKHPSKKYRK